ncbi:MAG: hypothetical protein KF686_16470 [Ramlibacter sp.]|nr:hypothetical protein [Ramlibacter sp.]
MRACPLPSYPAVVLALAATCLAPAALAQSCEGGAYLNPQLFRGEAAHQSAVAEQEMHAFIGRTGLPQSPLYSIKRVDDITASGRTPYCWTYANPVVGFLSGYKLVLVNTEPVHPAVLAITHVVPGAAADAPAVPLKSLPGPEQKAILDQLSRSKCFGTAAGVEAAIVKAEGLCGNVEDVAPQVAVGQQGLIAKAAFAWEEQAWAGIATREAPAMGTTLKGLAGRVEKVHSARLVVVPSRGTSVGFGLFVHPSVSDATIKKAVAAFQGLSTPSRPLAIALDLGQQFNFVTPTAEQVEKMRAAIGLGN